MLSTLDRQRVLRRRHARVRAWSTPTTCCDLGRPWFWLLVALTLRRLGGRSAALDRPVDVRDPARARRAARPGQRHGRHGHRRVLRHHVRVQRPRDRPASGWAGRCTSPSPSPSSRSSTCGRSTSTNPSRRPDPDGSTRSRRRARRHRRHPRRARPDAADRPRRLQQPPARRVHGPDGRLRPVARVRRDVGLPVGRHQPRLHRRRADRRPVRARPSPVRVVLLGNLVNWTICATFTLRSSIVLLTIGTFVWLLLIPMIEAAEQTVLQRVDPVRTPGPRVRLRPARRERRLAAHGADDRPARRRAS